MAAARRLLVERALRFDLRAALQAEVFSELEWVLIKRRRERDEEADDEP